MSGQRGFTLLELLIALTLMALVAGVVFGALDLSARSWDRGEARSEKSDQMRLTQELLRSELTVAFPLRWRKIENQPLGFSGTADQLRFAAPLVARVGQGGLFWLQLSLQDAGDKRQLVLQRAIPDHDATAYPDFPDEDKTVLADDIEALRISYFGPTSDTTQSANQQSDVAWQDQWIDRRSIPQLVKLAIKPKTGAPWPELLVEPKVSSAAGCLWDNFYKRCLYL